MDIKKTAPVAVVAAFFVLAAAALPVLAANLVQNGTFETAGATSDVPQGWSKGRWGTNTAVFEYPVAGAGGGKAAKVTLTSRTTGDAKWAHVPVAVSPGTTYEYADQYIANVPTILVVEYEMSDGSLRWDDLASVPAAATFSAATASFTPPSGAVKARVFHLINQVGNLTIDSVTIEGDVPPPPPPPPDPDNLVPNASLEQESGGLPVSWAKGRWGTNTAVFTYPVAGFSSAKAARVALTAHTSGDAKWYFNPVAVTAGTYEFSNRSKSNVPTFVTVQMRTSSGAISYLDLGSVPPSTAFQEFRRSFTVPSGVTSLTVFHVINRVGTLDVDTYALTRTGGGGQTGEFFDQGYVTLTFDDGYRSDYDLVFPRLKQAGFKSTHFLVTERIHPGDFPGFIKVNEILEMQAAGLEIGAHTRTHPDLAAIAPSVARQEIEGSRADLLAIGATPVNVFAYPFGSYNPSVQTLVRNAGFVAARSSDGGFNKRNTDKYALKRLNMTQAITTAEVKANIDAALRDKTWLILLFHRVDNSGEFFTVSPAFFNDIISYMEGKGIDPLTVSEGVAKMQ